MKFMNLLVRGDQWSTIVVRVALPLALVGLVSGVIALAEQIADVTGLAVLYMGAVMVAAIVAGRGAATIAAIAAFLAFDVLFIQPRYTVAVSDPAEWVTLCVLLLTGLVTGQLAALVRQRTYEARANERAASVLYRVAHEMAGQTLDAALQSTATILCDAVDAAGARIEVHSAGGEVTVAAGDAEALRYMQSTGRYSEGRILATAQDISVGFQPRRWVSTRTGLRHRQERRYDVYHVRVGTDDTNWISVALANGQPALDPISQRLLVTAADEIAEALERERLRHEATEVEALRRADELRATLLNTVSHDLRTPLAAIVAAADSLHSEIDWNIEERGEFVEAIAQEARRLDEMVRHLLDLSRVESGTLALAKEWHDPVDVVAGAITRMRDALPGRRIDLEAPNDLPLVQLDPVAIGEVVGNLVENACRHTTPETTVIVSLARTDGGIEIAVDDDGEGIPEDVLPHLFEPFARARGLRDRRGTGLGLAVARALVEAHGGTISASNRPEGGARFVVTLPQSTPVAAPGGAA